MASNLIIKVGLKGANKVVGGLKGLATTVGNTTKRIAKFATSWKVAVGAVASIGVPLRMATKFADGLREIQTIGGQTDKELTALGKSIRQVSAEFGQDFSATTKAQYDIISAGIQGSARQLDVLRASSALAVAGVSDVGTTADVITSAMNSYGQANLDAGHASDVLFKTVEKGKTTIPELGASLGQVLPFASSAGIGLEIVGASMASITAKGVSTAEATTALKGAIIALDTPTQGAKKAMEDLGFAVSRTSDGNLDFAKTMQDLEKLDSEAITKIIPNIRGQLAVKSITADLNNFNNVVESFNDVSGSTNRAVEQVNKSFGQQARMLSTNVKSAFVEFGTVLANSLLPHVEEINKKLAIVGDIGYAQIASNIIGNFSAILQALRETFIVLIGRAVAVLPNQIAIGLKKAFEMIKVGAVFMFEPIAKYAQIVALKVKSFFITMVNGVLTAVNTMISGLNKLPGVSLDTFSLIESNVQDQINGLINTQTKFEAMFQAGKESNESASNAIKGIWAGLNEAIFARNEEAKASNQSVVDGQVEGEAVVQSAKVQTAEATKNLATEEKKQFATTLSGLRSSITGFLAQAIARAVAKEAGKGLAGLITGTAVAIGITSLFDKYVPKFAKGGQFVTDKPQLFMAGDNPGGMERVTVEPLSSPGFSQGKNIVVNISAPLVDETVRDSILPSIKEAINMELA